MDKRRVGKAVVAGVRELKALGFVALLAFAIYMPSMGLLRFVQWALPQEVLDWTGWPYVIIGLASSLMIAITLAPVFSSAIKAYKEADDGESK